jgi:acetolactate synthase-1/2/3 large subunit
MKYTGAEIIIKLLEIHGIERISGIPGGANLPMYHALGASSIRHILARHEQGAGFIAQGQARSTGEVAVFFATSGPGATNALTAVADAKLDSVPIICISGQVPLDLIGTDAFQEIDAYGLSVPITKHNYLVRNVEELLEIIPEAFYIAREGRPGPVWIDVPKDVQNTMMEITEWPDPIIPKLASIDHSSSLEAAAKLINQSERPILYVGGGAIQSDAHSKVIHLLNRTDALATTTLMGLGSIPSEHPSNIGMLGMHGSKYTNLLLSECDALIALGVRFDDRATGKVSEFCPDAKVVHIDIDPSEISKIRRPEVAITGDLCEVLGNLIPLITPSKRPDWRQRREVLLAENPIEFGGSKSVFDGYGLLDHCAQSCKRDFFVTTDVGQHQMRVAQRFPFFKPRQFLTSGGLGTMGFGLPAAIGAALENPDATVLCVTGDGSLLMNIQELVVAAEENLNVKIIVCNNNALGLVVQQQRLFYGQNYQASKFSSAPDFSAIANAFGVPGYDLAGLTHPENTLDELLSRKGPALINVAIDVYECVFPMVPPGGSNNNPITRDPILESKEAFA